MGFSESSDSNSSIRPGITRRNSRILLMPSSWMSMITPPIRMYAWFIRSPVTDSNTSISTSRSRKP